MHRTKKTQAKLLIFTALAVVLLWMAPQAPAETWSCEDALHVCAALNWSAVDPTGIFRCIMGYSFCIEYLERHLKK